MIIINKIKKYPIIMLAMGVIFVIYGWTQSMDVMVRSSIAREVFVRRTVKCYVFIVSGGLLIFLSYILDILVQTVIKENEKLTDKIAELEDRMKTKI